MKMNEEDIEGQAFRRLQERLLNIQTNVLEFSSFTNAQINGLLLVLDEVLPINESKVVQSRKLDRIDDYGAALWQVVGLLHSTIEFKTKAELARKVIGDRGKPISRQRLQAILEKVVKEGLAVDPFTRKDTDDISKE
jgi:hypothetical protein